MASLYTRTDSPYIWLRYYDKHEGNPVKKRKSVSTKLLNNQQGWKQARELKKRVEAAQVQREFYFKSGLDVRHAVTLMEGMVEYFTTKPQLAEKSKMAYRLAVEHFIKCRGNKNVDDYNNRDFAGLINYFKLRNLSQNSISFYTHHLSVLWNYFLKKHYVKENIIVKVSQEQMPVEIIPIKDMKIILNYFKKRNIKHHHLIYFMLLTGFRISSALVQSWDRVDLKTKLITATNVKSKKIFYFPIHFELETLLKEMKPKKEGRLFDYATGSSPKFWRENITKLHMAKKIAKKYSLHLIRKTFTSYMVNSGVNQSLLVKLLDHSSLRVTDSYYTRIEGSLLRDQFKNVRFVEGKKSRALK